MRVAGRVIGATVLALAVSCTAAPPPDTRAADEEAVRKADADWQSTKVEVARSSDLAYLYGTYEVSYDEAPGKRTTDRGKIVEVWRKQADGSWKCIVDTWNSDLPAAPSTPAA
jgi:hypothetical protein